MEKILLFLSLSCGLHGFSQLIQIPVYASISSQPAQPGSEVAKLLDGDNATIYPSKWSQNGIPDEVKFYFTSNVASIKKLIYTPRQSDGTNGIWTNVSISYISYSTQTAPNTFISVSNNLIWPANAQDKEVVFPLIIQENIFFLLISC
ncbi:hypothetical protein D1631_18540 [Chryseobacterium nematophagum]|uniref:F5/8 type C domain-containing protein n=1 Tax=Chryseobacterium nematophagum TaxID=2305228 RepID=A0A3M7TB67_9FLAO|nr:hypothetical protein [Chryseobacterium nematophagum]RNA60491.1 hypothetical protein D1631_18540 [Chryseobacterium nematophagum]